jgi:proliferating cell nuclear antigen
VQITAAPEKVSFRGVGEGGKASETELGSDGESVFSISAEEPVSGKYAVETLIDINSKMKSVSKRVRVELSSGKPIRLTYEFTTGTFTAVVAPRVD